MTETTSRDTLFVWRPVQDPGWLNLGVEGVGPTLCPACSTKLDRTARDEPDDEYIRTPVILDCSLCGWSIDYVVHGNYVNPYEPHIDYEINTATVLREFAVSSTDLGFDELGSYLRTHPDALHKVQWRRFEALVADVYRELGFRVVLTQESRDGGADILVLHDDGRSISTIIECKRYSPGRRIGVSLVRTLVGAAVMWDARRTVLVTTSDFTSGAQISAHNYRSRGFEVDLVAASDLVKLLGVYNPTMTPLADLSEDERRYIAERNRR